ncbi:translation initiation factor IF-2 [Pneumocystis carinii B80]|uniref:Translation initiation factor IF-2, mitochondrial n=1 Tax=Pneumocystis carinii (strain B80) TaxID=1408658 RepID=A0A0W4ZG03_PNEC8|nr:translation initiation factor IF-2 [Pneumocystis carinii B80]KTW27288.1 translation initiation factor IF-2 [Pneumocystis carinii B80]
MFILNIRKNDLYYLNYLKVLYKRFHSIQNLRVYLNKESKPINNISNNIYKGKNILEKDKSKKENLRSEFLKTSNFNKNVKINQKFKEKSEKNRGDTFRKLNISENTSFSKSKLPNSKLKSPYTRKDSTSKSSEIVNKDTKSLFNSGHSGLNKKERFKKDFFNFKKSDIAKLEKKTKKLSSKSSIHIPNAISISNLSQLLKLKLEELSRKMKELGFKNTNHDFLLTFEEASLIAMEYNYNPITNTKNIIELPSQKNKKNLKLSLRIPVVTIMGHVDHGKTTLLDFFRKSSIAKKEHGGITQHIGAFSVTMSNGEKICFLDTPGHSAFESMRKRGSLFTDIIILLVAADDGVMEQTIEVIEHAKRANVPIIVAVNKIDKEVQNIQDLKLDLLKNGVELEEYGGDTQLVLISAITGQGIKDLECAISSLVEISDIKSKVEGNVEGVIIESSVKRTKGPLATVLLKEGTLKLGSHIVSGTTWCRVRSMTDDLGTSLKSALPGTAVEVMGWKDIPLIGENILEVENEEQAKKIVKNRLLHVEEEKQLSNIENINKSRIQNYKNELKPIKTDSSQKEFREVPFIIKGDVSGSVEAIKNAILSIGNDKITTKVVYSDVGDVTESDVILASAIQGYIISFNLKLDKKIAQIAYREKIKIISHSIIYTLLDYIKEELSLLMPLIEKHHVVGEAKILKIFNITNKKSSKAVAGCIVINGVINKNEKIRIVRDQKIIWKGKLETLRHIKKEIIETKKGEECGMSFDGYENFLEGDLVQGYTEEFIRKKL